jgi:hypothetical protein
MTPTITAFERSPDRGKGQARDMRVRWALEEVGQPYDVRLVSFSEMKKPAHCALHPFGQIPTYEKGDLADGVPCDGQFEIAHRPRPWKIAANCDPWDRQDQARACQNVDSFRVMRSPFRVKLRRTHMIKCLPGYP